MERSGLWGHRLASINGELRVLNFKEPRLLPVITFNSMSLVIGYENRKSRYRVQKTSIFTRDFRLLGATM